MSMRANALQVCVNFNIFQYVWNTIDEID
uniref:Uncharacterized protein n=1 Tax=mine drainage metagenome TaxID=410659 RepID=E6PRU7_9ZZZZ